MNSLATKAVGSRVPSRDGVPTAEFAYELTREDA